MNRPRALALMGNRNLHGIVGTTPENVAYITGFWASTTWRHRSRKLWAVLPTDPKRAPYLILSATTADVVVAQQLDEVTVYLYGQFHYDGIATGQAERRLLELVQSAPRFATPEQALLAVLRDAGMDSGRIAVDEWGIPAPILAWLAEQLPNAVLEQGYALLRQIRMIKTPAEVERIRAVTSITEGAFKSALAEVRPGRSEAELADAFRLEATRFGALPTLVVIGAGRRGALPTATAGDYRVQVGDLIRFDIGCFYDQFHSDIARTVVVREATAEGAAMHAAVLAGLESALETVRPGVRASDVFHAAVRGVETNGIRPYKRHHCGHGEGREGYEPPMIAPDDETLLEPGMVLCVETPYYRLGVGGVQVEDTAVVTDEGYAPLSTLPRDLIIAG